MGIAAGTTALRYSGMPVKKLCFGRIDDSDGSKSLVLGPSALQKRVAPCAGFNGNCSGAGLGSSTVGLIYLNPEGPVLEEGGSPVPDPELSVRDVRENFENMGHDARATV